MSFRLDKCEFFQPRVEYVGYDLTSTGNCPARSKFNMVRDWPLPSHGQSLFSFVGLVNFYHRFAPYFELKLKPLRRLCRTYHRKTIPPVVWTPSLIELFNDLKNGLLTSPVLARFDTAKPTFLKTDWSGKGMGWILMQPSNDNDAVSATCLLQTTGKCLFDLSKNGPRL